MAGIYIHIPFCAQKCSYCNFYSVANLALKSSFLNALLTEIEMREGAFKGQIIETIYFGGGTPSVLDIEEVKSVLGQIRRHYTLSESMEVTFEANPDDLSEEYLIGLRLAGVNRLSIGVQSFDDRALKSLNRRHSGADAVAVVENAMSLGFSNLSIDLIYGIPHQTDEQWVKNLLIASQHQIAHLSCYALTVEERTVLHKQIEKGRVTAPSEEDAIRQFNLLMDFAEQHGYQQYEISNFCRDNQVSKHNSAYWSGVPYLGFGPGAHSYLPPFRRWNVSDVRQYNESMAHLGDCSEEEELTERDRFNEYVMTSLRTASGCSLGYVKNQFDPTYLDWLIRQKKRIQSTWFKGDNDAIILSREGKLMADYITRELFFDLHL